MSLVFIHATLTLDGFLAGPDGEVDWMFDFPSAPEDQEVVDRVCANIGAVVGGANTARTIEDGEIPYGGMVKAPVFLMTHTPAEPIERDGITYTFVVDDIATAVESAKRAAGEKWVSLLGGSISRQCLHLGLVDEIHLDVVPVLLGDGISLFAGLGMRVDLERLETSAFASETHLRFRVVQAAG
ncbi:dihydrofolate reductase [Microbacterium sp. AK009]|uniref:dihydrofolate reductase family protein n=1 Tax=Microbacterium sp. AK009 TaxID=2723068 RepID=UPI0015CA30FA|nr:dihydrofolate reductase family protein [Microbacterium sp. AK009]NYF15666.1 dihydrofolate reductase [Microbacterium sp. AK009]